MEEALGLNLMEMDMRQYDPAIARWTSIDPVVHHSMSTYNAFDNNPIYWADPSGADASSFIMNLFNKSKEGVTTYDGKGNQTSYTSSEEIEKNGNGGTDPGNGFTNALAFQESMNPISNNKDNTTTDDGSKNSSNVSLSWKSAAGAGFLTMAAPFPKAFVAPGASTHSSIFSTLMGKTPLNKNRISFRGKRRLYTHTLNGSKRYATTWGRYIGRWGARIVGPVGTALIIYDVVDFYYKGMIEDTRLMKENPVLYRIKNEKAWNWASRYGERE